MSEAQKNQPALRDISFLSESELNIYELSVQGDVAQLEPDVNDELIAKIKAYKQKTHGIVKEYPLPETPYKIGVYIRFYNQTDHPDEEMLQKNKQEYIDIISACPAWELVDFYVDNGSSVPYMSNSKEWCRLLDDCFRGRVNLIVTRLLKGVSRDVHEIEFVARVLARHNPPIGIYFRSEDIFTLASYFQGDLQDGGFLPDGWNVLPEDEIDEALRDGEFEERRLTAGS